MIIIVPEARDRVPPARTEATFRWLSEHAAELAAAGFEVVVEHMTHSWRTYEDVLRLEWERHRGFMVLEHDVVPGSVEDLRAIAECDEQLCYSPVESHVEYFPRRPRFMGTSCSAGKCDAGPTSWFIAEGGIQRETKPGDIYAHQTGTGLIKFGKPLLERYRAWPLGPGESNIDGRFWSSMRNAGRPVFAHLHWRGGVAGQLVEHHHRKCAGDVDQSVR